MQESPEIREALRVIEPLPSCAVLMPAIQIQQSLRANLRLSEEILIFRGQAASMGASRRHRLVAHLSIALQTRRQELFRGLLMQALATAEWFQ